MTESILRNFIGLECEVIYKDGTKKFGIIMKNKGSKYFIEGALSISDLEIEKIEDVKLLKP